MPRYLTILAGLIIVFLLLFGLAQYLRIPYLSDAEPIRQLNPAWAAVIGIGLLTGDVILPVPSSFVMIANGAVFGILPGAAVSIVGSLGSAVIGFYLGRKGAGIVSRLVPEEERCRMEALLARWGMVVIIVTRPVPLIAESISIIAGTTVMTWRTLVVATIAGLVPGSLLYAVTGATAHNLNNAYLAFAIVIVIAGVFWCMGRRSVG